MARKSIVLLIIILTILLVAILLLFPRANKQANPLPGNQAELSPQQILDIMKTDKDYNDFSDITSNFDPETAVYTKLGPQEYQEIRQEWQKQGLQDRISAIDKITLTDSTYWVELKNKNDETKGLRALVDIRAGESLFMAGSLLIQANIGL